MKLKKILALVLAIAMVLSTMSFSVFAEGESATEVAEDYVAAIGEQGYETLQAAIDAVQNENTIVLLKESDEDVIVVQTPDIAFTIDGNDNTMSGTITIDGKSAAYATAGLTIENVNFDATSITKDASINFGGTNDTRYISNVTVKNCTFTGEGNVKVGIKSYTGGDKNLTITGCKATGMHSLAQLKNVAGVTVTECNIEGKSGISIGASHDVVVSNCVMTLSNYGVRADAIEEGAGVEISDCEISAFIPVVVRNVSENYDLAFSGTNTMTASNTDDIWCAVGASEYEKNGELPTAPETGEVTVTLDDNGLSVEGIYNAASADEEELSVMEIYDWEDLKELDALVESGNQLEGVTVKLMNDIDLYQMGEDGEPVTFNPIGANTSYFKGTFDGQGHTIKNMYQSGWALGYDWYNYGTIGLFAYLWNATVKNLTIEDAECFVEGGNVASIAGCAWGDCTFENITVKNSTFATYNNRAAGIVGYTGGQGTMTFKDIVVDENTVIAGLWGSFDSSLGGLIGSIQDPTKIVIEDTTVKCRLDAYNDCTAAYKYYAYRMCGMLIGKMPVDSNNKPVLDNVSIANVEVEFDKWANYTYVRNGTDNENWKRVEAGYAYDGVDLSTYADPDYNSITFESLFGGQQYGSYGQSEHEDVEVTYAYVAKNGDDNYWTLTEALSNANAGDTITLIANVDEDVTIDKNITIDGSDKNYTGTMTISKSINFTINDVNFIGGNIKKPKSTGTSGTYSITNCSFDSESDSVYAIEIRGSYGIIIENCTSEGYYGFLQVPSSNNSVSIKDVTIDETSYAIKVDYSNGVSLENVVIENSTYGFVNSNFGTKTIAVKNCTIKADYPLVIWDRDTKKVNTFKFEGNNDFGTNEFFYNKVTEEEMGYTEYVLSKDATFTAVEGLTVTSSNEAYDVIYDNNTYMAAKTVKVGDDLYYSLQEAIDAASDGDTITVLTDIKNIQNVTINKNVVIDLNAHTVNGAILPSNGDITIKNGWIKNTDNGQSAIEINSGKLNLANVNIESARHAVRIDGEVEAVIDGGTYKVVPIDGKTVHAVNVSGNANVVIKNGEFIGPKGTVADSGAAVNVQEGSTVTIEGGTFTGGKNNTLATKGTLAIYGGIYDQDPSAYVVDGYKTSDKANNFYVVYPEFKVSAIVNDADKTVKAGEEFEVYITVTGGDYTNAGWKLGYDPTKVEYVKAEGGVDAVDYAIVDSVLGEGQTSGNEYKNGEVYKKYTFRAKYPSTTVNSVFTIENAYVNNYEMAAWLDKTPAAMEGDTVTITNDLAFGGTIADKEVTYNGMYQKAEEFVANMTGAEITYSTEENGKYTTEVPAFKDAGEHTYYYKATLAGYTAVTGSAKLTITPATLAPDAEFNVDPDYDTVSVKAVLENLIDDSFKGTVTIEIDGEKVTFEASEFSYDGNGKAVAKQFKKIDLEEGKEYPVKVTYTANTAGDNYANAEGETKVNPDKKEITSDDLNSIKAALTNSFVYDGVKHYVEVDEAKLPGEWKVEIPEVGLTDVGETMVEIKATDESGKYNEHTFNVVLKVTPKKITIRINNANKALGQPDPVFTSNINEILVAEGDLGEVKYVREAGEAMGTYKITVNYTPNPNYEVIDIVKGNLYIGAPTDFKVEVVNNKLLKGDDYKQDYIAGYRLVLVYTNVDKAYFTYKGQEMYDVSDAPYEYYDYDFATMTATKDATEYKHIYAIVVEAEYGYEDTAENEAMYANNVEFASESAKPEKILYNSDVNYTGELDVEDFSITNGIYNVLYRGKAFITRLLKADANGNKLVDTEDARMIKEVVVK